MLVHTDGPEVGSRGFFPFPEAVFPQVSLQLTVSCLVLSSRAAAPPPPGLLSELNRPEFHAALCLSRHWVAVYKHTSSGISSSQSVVLNSTLLCDEMSQSVSSVPSPELRESLQVSSVTLLVLVPCVVLLLLLNCLLLGYKLLLLARTKRARCGSDSVLLRSSSCLSARHRLDPGFGPARRPHYVSVSEAGMAPPITSSLTSSAERRAACGQRCRPEALARPDGAPCVGSGSLRVPSALLGGSRGSHGSRAWRRSAPGLVRSSDSETERDNVAPPNSPEQLVSPSRVRVLTRTAPAPQLGPD